MTMREIAQSIAQDLGLTQVEAKEAVQKVFDAVVDALVEEGHGKHEYVHADLQFESSGGRCSDRA